MTEPTLRLDAVDSADIRGQKTRLRPMRPDEAPLFYKWATDREVQPFWGEADHYDSLDGFLQHWHPHYFDGSQPDCGRCFAIEIDGCPIGMIAYNRVDVFNGSTEIDIIIGDPVYRDRGYGTDAIRAFLGFLFDTVGLHRVWLGTYDHNARAQRAYEKCGFVREGVMRKSDWLDGRWVDSVIYGILEHEFREGGA
jgi:RimJ/RimL family protein N-acetyltransferase